MGAVWLRLRAELRVRPGGLVALVVLVAIAGGTAMAGVAGAVRTRSALTRQAVRAQVTDAAVITRTPNRPTAPEFSFAAVSRLPQVTAAYRLPYTYYRATLPSGQVITYADLPLHISGDARVGRTLDRLKLVAGRMADPSAPDELVLSAPDAQRLGLRIGSEIRARFGSRRQQPGLSRAVNAPGGDPAKLAYLGPRVTLKVVGLSAGLGTLAIDFGGARLYRPALLTPAFHRRYGADAVELPLFFVRLEHGPRDLPAFAASLGRLAEGGETSFQPTGGATAQFQRGVTVDATVLGVLSGLVAALGLALAGQGLARRSAADADDLVALRALGFTRAQRFGVGVARSALVATLGTALGLGLAVALSPLLPLNDLARLAEPDPGLRVDAGVLAGGAIVSLVCVVLAGAHAAWRAADAGSPAQPRSRTPRLGLARPGLPLPASLGALGARRSPAMLVLTATALALIAATLTCVASFHRLTSTPHWYGQNYDATVGGGGAGSVEIVQAQLRHDLLVRAFVGGSRTQVTIGRQPVSVLGLAPGAIGPTVLAGSAPRAPDEIMLGTRTLAALHAAVGQSVTLRAGGKDHRLRIVGRGVIPSLNDNLRLGTGATMTFAGLQGLVPNAVVTYEFVRFNVDSKRATAAFAREYGPRSVPPLPADLANVQRTGNAAAASVALLGLIGITALLYALASSTRARRRDLAILKTLGLTPRQTAAVVAWQATIETLPALAIGLPAGALIGRWVWFEAADQLGVANQATVPFATLFVVIATAIALANLVTLPAVRSAVRLQPALVLRVE
jgi:putative ABC transport system permease protein